MTVRVELCSFLRRYLPRYDPVEGIVVEVGAKTPVDRVMDALGIPSESVEIITINRLAVKGEHLLEEGDLVGLFTTPGGG